MYNYVFLAINPIVIFARSYKQPGCQMTECAIFGILRFLHYKLFYKKILKIRNPLLIRYFVINKSKIMYLKYFEDTVHFLTVCFWHQITIKADSFRHFAICHMETKKYPLPNWSTTKIQLINLFDGQKVFFSSRLTQVLLSPEAANEVCEWTIVLVFYKHGF